MIKNESRRYIKYALGEIILVMIGILLALQVNNWNIERTDRILELKYLRNIKLDLEKDLKNLKINTNKRMEKSDGIKKLLKHLNGQPIEDLNELSSLVYNTVNEWRFTPNNATYNELANSGNLNLISNDSIKLKLLELEELYIENSFGIEHETNDYREYISKPLFHSVEMDKLMLVFNGAKTAEELSINLSDFEELFSLKEYKNGILIINIISEYLIEFYKIIVVKSKSLILMIDKEIQD